MESLDGLPESLKVALLAFARSEYERGRSDAIASIMSVAKSMGAEATVRAAPEAVAHEPERRNDFVSNPSNRVTSLRAPRGLVGQVLRSVMKKHYGKAIIELEALAENADPRIAAKSVGNELRRREGKEYERFENNRWRLIGQQENILADDIESLLGQSSTKSYSNQEGGDGHAATNTNLE